MGMGAIMNAMETLAEIERERVRGLEESLQGQDKITYETLKEKITEKNKKTWKKTQVVGLVGLLTIASSVYPLMRGVNETNYGNNLNAPNVVQKDSQNKHSFQTQTYNRSPFLNYAWLTLLLGNVICAGSIITGQNIMSRRAKPLREYLDSHSAEHTSQRPSERL